MRVTFFCLLLIGFAVAGLAYREVGTMPSAEDMKSFDVLPYFRDGEFHNPQGWIAPKPEKAEEKVSLIKMILFSPHAPRIKLPMVELEQDSFSKKPEKSAVYWLGHSSAIVDFEGKRLGIDLVFGNASPFPLTVRRYQKAPLKRKDLPDMDYVLLTHNHYDHTERATIKALKDKKFVVPLGMGAMLRSWGVSKENITELGWGETFEAEGLKITAVESIHFSSRSFWDHNKTLWVSYVIESKGRKIFWGGDSGYGTHYEKIGKKYGPFEWAALEIDAWNLGWPMIHMFPEQMVQAVQDLRAKKALPIHWGAYELAYHNWDESINRVIEAAKGKDFELMTPRIGEKLVPEKYTPNLWWKEPE